MTRAEQCKINKLWADRIVALCSRRSVVLALTRSNNERIARLLAGRR